MKENSIEEITFVENEIKNARRVFEEVGCHVSFGEDLCKAIDNLLSDYKRVLKENECLKNHVHYKNCIACGKEFRSKRDDAKYCIKCSKQVANKNYIANLTEEQKLKRREQAKLAMRKLRANRK